jgi:hypothetical protein
MSLFLPDLFRTLSAAPYHPHPPIGGGGAATPLPDLPHLAGPPLTGTATLDKEGD